VRALPAFAFEGALDWPSRSTADAFKAFRAAVRTAATDKLLFPAALLMVRVAMASPSVVLET
jgi:hypothetical protein